MTDRGGLTLLEVMVALVILSIAVAGFLETVARAARAAADAGAWAQALTYAEDGQEALAIGDAALTSVDTASPGTGFARRVVVRPWRDGVVRGTVIVALPNGARLELDRLLPAP
jgi:prepilin-type N-terminal cleavage/methylation domain-containing protein